MIDTRTATATLRAAAAEAAHVPGCFCDDCDAMRAQADRDARAEERREREERLAHPSQHPLVWR